MENSQPKKKNAGLTALIALLLIITTVASCVGLYAWAKYISSQNGQATAQIAKWYFNLKTGEETIDGKTKTLLELTRTDEYGHVAQGKIAPGTHGELPIIIDTTGTEVDLQYDLVVVIENCPTNMTFTTSDATKTTVVRSGTGTAQDPKTATITVTKYISHSVTDANRKHNETITWNWPYETLDANNSAVAGDEVDKADNGKEITVRVSATGTEKLEDPNAPAAGSVQARAKAGEIERGDSVNYNPGTLTTRTASIDLPAGATIEGSRLASVTIPSGASLSGEINAASAGDWEVLDITNEGEVLIIPRTYSPTGLKLEGKDGYDNAITALNNVASIYLNPTYATSARSLTVEDVNKREESTPDGMSAEYTWNHRYGMNPTTLNITDTGSDSDKPSQTYTITATTGRYHYSTNNFSDMNCWLASRCVGLDSSYCGFDVRNLDSGDVGSNYLFVAYRVGDTSDNSNSYPVVPVVSLKSNIQMEKVNDVWMLNGDSKTFTPEEPIPETATGTATATE